MSSNKVDREIDSTSFVLPEEPNQSPDKELKLRLNNPAKLPK